MAQSLGDRARRQRKARKLLQTGDRDAGIGDLVPPRKHWQRQIEPPRPTLVAHTGGRTLTRPRASPSTPLSRGAGEGTGRGVAFNPLPYRGRGGTACGGGWWVRVAAPFFLPAVERCANGSGAGLDDGGGIIGLRADHRRRAGLQDAGLLAGDRRDGVAEKGLVVERDRGDRGDCRPGQYIGRVESATEPGFEQHDVGRDPREGKERRRRRDLEKGDRRVLVGTLAFLEQREQRVLLDQLPGQPDPLVEADEMRRGVDMHTVPGGFEAGAQRRDG